MPYEDSDEDCDQGDDDDTERCRAPTALTVSVHYNRAISHTGRCSFRRLLPTYTQQRQADTRSVTKVIFCVGSNRTSALLHRHHGLAL